MPPKMQFKMYAFYGIMIKLREACASRLGNEGPMQLF